ncbi:hypothetical protein JOM56_008130 [Amanita muscaria]
MDVDQVPVGEPMEVDDVEVRHKQRVVRVTVDVVVPAGELMGADSVPAQRWPVLPRPAWNVHAPAQRWPVLPRPAWNIDATDYQRWPVLPRPAWNVDMADYAKISPALIVGGTRTPDLAVNNRWLKISRTPDYNIYNEPTTLEDDDTDYSSLSMGYPPSEDTEDSLPELDFAEADTSLNWAPGILTPETPHRIRRTTLFSPLSPVRQSKLGEDDVFITSKRQTAELVNNNGWLRTSHTPGNIDNESVFYDNEYTDYSYLALAYPLVEDSDTSLNEDYTMVPLATWLKCLALLLRTFLKLSTLHALPWRMNRRPTLLAKLFLRQHPELIYRSLQAWTSSSQK